MGINFSGLTLAGQAGCGYIIDNDNVIRALWVSDLEHAKGSFGVLIMTLTLHEKNGRVSDIPYFVKSALSDSTFQYAENNVFENIGGFIIMFDEKTLPMCGRLAKRIENPATKDGGDFGK